MVYSWSIKDIVYFCYNMPKNNLTFVILYVLFSCVLLLFQMFPTILNAEESTCLLTVTVHFVWLSDTITSRKEWGWESWNESKCSFKKTQWKLKHALMGSVSVCQVDEQTWGSALSIGSVPFYVDAVAKY